MNYTKAAAELNLTQPAVSQHIKYLEGFYTTKLFSYNKKKLSLTKSGELLKSSMLSMHHDELYLKNMINHEKEVPELKFGATLSIGEYLLGTPLAKYLKNCGETNCTVTIADTKMLMNMLDDGAVDFALVEGYFEKSEYDCRLIKAEELVPVCSVNFDCSNIKSFEDLFKCNLLIREKGSGTREVFTNYLREHGYSVEQFKSYSVFNSLNLIIQLLKETVGISFLYRTVVKNDIKNKTLKEIPLPEFCVSHEFNFIWRKNSIFSAEYEKVYNELFKHT